eukprot:CAMPEP_0184477308 /NCGR_PEP_ID=MMETSP0740-20130409/147530_1 /TAXON_ID=385413 /ORGANISM="Thalassiosira miniscula, Strain CCMP1093" /LENGTH=135 /DNA_ID=CAMNT_0026854889 /DNA_START=428 /DNA_END=837 /DNA_ORIENTATION=+
MPGPHIIIGQRGAFIHCDLRAAAAQDWHIIGNLNHPRAELPDVEVTIAPRLQDQEHRRQQTDQNDGSGEASSLAKLTEKAMPVETTAQLVVIRAVGAKWSSDRLRRDTGAQARRLRRSRKWLLVDPDQRLSWSEV